MLGNAQTAPQDPAYGQLDPGALDAANPACISRGTLFPYTGSPGIYRCSLDDRNVGGVPYVRTYSMNNWMNGLSPAVWVGGLDPSRAVYQKDSALPAPSRLFVFVDGDQAGINDAMLTVVIDPGYGMYDFPTRKEQSAPGVNVFTSFDAHNGFDQSVAWAVMNGSQDGYRGQAEWFVPTGSGPLNVVDLAMMGKGSINVTVTEDKSGLPGKPLETFLNIPSSRFGNAGHLVLVSEAHPVLNAGAKYWLCVEPADSDTGCSWCYNNQNPAKGFAFERGPGGWSFFQGDSRNGAFRINVVQ
jgi:hypothetical protein